MTFLIEYASDDLAVFERSQCTTRENSGCPNLIGSWEGVKENKSELGVRDPHRCISEHNPGLVYLSKLWGHWLCII